MNFATGGIEMRLGILSSGVDIILEMVNPGPYTIVPMHDRPDLLMETIRLINSEWPASERRRLQTLESSCDNFPICLILLKDERVIGHCRMSRLPSKQDSSLMETFVIDRDHRSQGLGSKLLQAAGELMSKKGIKKSFLSTKGQEQFYSKNGYTICEIADIKKDLFPPDLSLLKPNSLSKTSGPPPPPMPRNCFNIPSAMILYPGRTHMLKHL